MGQCTATLRRTGKRCRLSACLKAGDKFLGLNLSHGGHLSHGSPVNFSGLMFEPIAYNVREEDQRVDYDQLESLARSEKPKLIIAGASAYSREWDYARIRKIADEIGAIFMVDMAHPAGLIAAGLLKIHFNMHTSSLPLPTRRCGSPWRCDPVGKRF